MNFFALNENCFYFHGPVNIGYVHKDDQGMLVDAGIDAATIKKVIKQLKERDLPITHLFITHAHADHYGGAAYLQKHYEIHTVAPVLEAAILQYPILEPLYLFGGNDPLPELRNKFLEGSPVRVDQVIGEGQSEIGAFTVDAHLLPGHSYQQLGIVVENILYAGDAYFSEKQLHKHKIPFLTDAYLALQSLEKLKVISCDGALPGHGEFEEEFHDTVQANIDYHQLLLNWLETKIAEELAGISHEDVVAAMCQAYQVSVAQLSQWLLFRTAVTSYLLALIKQEKVSSTIEDNRWIFRPAGDNGKQKEKG